MSHKTSTKHANLRAVPSNTEPQVSATVTSLHDQIQQDAYKLYESNGSQDGFAEQDWLEAERRIRPNRT